jgi:hypothetical protein
MALLKYAEAGLLKKKMEENNFRFTSIKYE